MASLPTRSWQTIVSTIVAGIQGRASSFIDFSAGEPLLAIAEGFAGVGLWLQELFLGVLQAARLATAVGADVDTFTVDFMPAIAGSVTAALPNGSPRLPAAYAAGYVTYSRFTAAATSPFVPVGATVQTADGTQQFAVVADTSNPAYSAALGGFSFTSGASTLTLKVQALNPGPAANAAAGAVTVMTTPIAGVDTVANGAGFTGGVAAETDAALKARFALFILGLTKGTYYGVASCLANLNVAIAYQIVDQFTYGGVVAPGYFYVVIDDGTGSPSSTFLSNAAAAIGSQGPAGVKPLGVNFSVFAPNLVSANVNMTLTTAAGYTHSLVVAQVSSLIAANIFALGLGNGLPFGLLYAWAFSVPGVTDVNGVTLNSGTADIAANPQNRVMPGTITVA
jgi:uncharacterized phage protein gp47/JayE